MRKKSDQGNVKRSDPPGEERRKYLKTVGALVAGLAVGGAAGWLSKPAERVEVPGVTVTERITETVPGPTVTKTVTAPFTPTPTPKPYEGITLTYLTTSPMVTTDLDAEFESLTGARIEVTTVAWPDLHPRLVTALAAKSPSPDLFIMPDEWTYEFGKAGWLTLLEDYLTPEEKAELVPIAVDMYSYEGHLISFVEMLMPHIMFYNSKILADAGFEPAKTWDEFVTQCKAMQGKGLVKYGVTWPLLSGDDMSYECFAVQLLSRGGRFFDEKGKPVFNDAIGVEALQFLVDSIYTDKIASPTSIEVEKMGSLHPFMAGEDAYNWNWQFMYPVTKDPATSTIVEYSKYALIPTKPGVKTAGFIGGGGLSVNPYSKYKEAAIAYGKFITGADKALRNFKGKGWMPWWDFFYKMPEAAEIEPQLPVLLKQMEMTFPRAAFKLTWYAEFAETMRLEISKAWLKEKTAKEALDSAAEKVNEKIAKYG